MGRGRLSFPKNLGVSAIAEDLESTKVIEMRIIEYQHVLKPSVGFLESCGVLLLNTKQMALFLGVPINVARHPVRIPMGMQLGCGKGLRWSVLELLEWVKAGCPRRREWIETRRLAGLHPLCRIGC